MLVAMRELAEIKAIERDVYGSQVAEREELVDTIADWGRRTALLEKEIHNIEEGEQGRQSEHLREEKADVEVIAPPVQYLASATPSAIVANGF